ncbi:MAG: efflux RND transporter permease subunit, partial [Cyclobacteriaceae bacterium]|nr:efflux RND transporter permease subunit [Cyclobacteriaceae bacterium]
GVVIAGPTINVEPDMNALAFFGITPANLQYQLQASLEGNVVSQFYDKEQLSAIRIVYPGNKTLSVAELKNIQIFLPNGTLKPIDRLAKISVLEGEAEIERENLQSMGVVTARLDQRDLGSVIKEIQDKISGEVKLPPGFGITFGGSFADQQQSFKELLIILITASLLVFGVILFLYREFMIALIILLVSVFGIAGSYLALYITSTPLNVGSYTGLIMIVGIIGENSIFTLLQFRESFKTQSAQQAIIYSISTRLRPKLMTALGAIVALMPIALGIGTGAQLHQPLAIAVIGGFGAALPLLLIVLPTLILLLYKNRESHPTND